MSEIPTKGNSIIVETPDDRAGAAPARVETGLTGWLVTRAKAWERFRINEYDRRWSRYWRLWRGFWATDDRNRQSERSRLIAPALAQAIEMTVSEIEEALFSRERWIDLADDVLDDENHSQLAKSVDLLREDLESAGVKDAISEAVLNSAIFGTGIMKCSTDVIIEKSLAPGPQGPELVKTQRLQVTWTAVRPDDFIPDPSGTTISEMLGCFHKMIRPTHVVLEKIERGIYLKSALNDLGLTRAAKADDRISDVDRNDPGQLSRAEHNDSVEILEYHGKVPKKMLDAVLNPELATGLPVDDILKEMDLNQRPTDGGALSSSGPLVEAIVTIANGSTLLRAMEIPFFMRDRSIIAWPFEKVPGRFWGRGVAEKGYNPQLALDAELRARQDALGFISAPMLGIDSGRIPRGFKMEIKPGKVWLTQGPPGEVLQPIKIGDLNANTFNQTQEMERMVQMGTGAFDTASMLGGSAKSASGGNAATSGSMAMGAFVKRSKRAIHVVDRKCLTPLVEKSMWRYMEFDFSRYPTDVKFQVKATLGIVAREVEQLNLTQVMAMLPQDFPAVTVAVAKGIIETANVHNKAEIISAMEEAMAPPSEEEQQRQAVMADLEFESLKATAQKTLLENNEIIARTRKLIAEADVAARKAENEDDRIAIEQMRTNLQLLEIEQFNMQNRIAGKRLDLAERSLDHKISEDKRRPAKT